MLKIDVQTNYKSKKIINVTQAKSIIHKLKNIGKSVGFCHGGFDLLHPGHVRHFESAKAMCDVLIVSVTSDRFVEKRKGSGRPIYNEKLRSYMIAGLQSVDYVVITDFEKGADVIKKIKPSIYIKGPDFLKKQTPGITAEREAIKSVGGEMKYTDDPKLSTTEIINYIQSIKTINMLIILDRDGTLIQSNDFFGKGDGWEKTLKFNKPVLDFLIYLQTKFKTTKLVISNQSGVARRFFTEKTVLAINRLIDRELGDKGIKIDSWQYCPDVDRKFAKAHPEIKFLKKYIKVKTDRKPAPDMVYKGLKSLGKDISEFNEILVLGDREEDKKLAGNLKAKFIDVKGLNYQELKISFNKSV